MPEKEGEFRGAALYGKHPLQLLIDPLLLEVHRNPKLTKNNNNMRQELEQ